MANRDTKHFLTPFRFFRLERKKAPLTVLRTHGRLTHPAIMPVCEASKKRVSLVTGELVFRLRTTHARKLHACPASRRPHPVHRPPGAL